MRVGNIDGTHTHVNVVICPDDIDLRRAEREKIAHHARRNRRSRRSRRSRHVRLRK